MQHIAALWERRQGVASIEAALAISLVLAPLSLGTIAYGTALADEARLDRALQSAVFYVWNNPTGFTASGIQAAAQAGFGSAAPTPTVTSSTTCYCVTSGYVKGAAVSCSGSCQSGQLLAAYLSVSASATFILPIATSTLGSSYSKTVTGTIRTK